MQFQKILHKNRIKKIIMVIKIIPIYLFNLFFSKKNVYLVTGARTGTSLYVAIALIKRGYNIYLITGNKKVIERLLAKKIFVTDFSEQDITNLVIIGKQKNIKAVLYGNSELYLTFVSRLAKEMNLIYISEEAALLSSDKQRLSEKLKNFDDRYVFYPELIEDTNILKEHHSQCFLKPVDGCGNDQVILCESPYLAYQYWQKNYRLNNRNYIIEQKFFGEQYDIQGISCNGEHNIILIKKNNYISNLNSKTLTQVFNYTPNLDENKRNLILNYTKDFLNAIGVTNGAFDYEVILDSNEKLYWIDFGNRIGAGGSEYIIEKATGIKWLDNFINNMLGLDLDLTKRAGNFMIMLFAHNQSQYDYLWQLIIGSKKSYSVDYEIQDKNLNCVLTCKRYEDLIKFEKEFLALV